MSEVGVMVAERGFRRYTDGLLPYGSSSAELGGSSVSLGNHSNAPSTLSKYETKAQYVDLLKFKVLQDWNSFSDQHKERLYSFADLLLDVCEDEIEISWQERLLGGLQLFLVAIRKEDGYLIKYVNSCIALANAVSDMREKDEEEVTAKFLDHLMEDSAQELVPYTQSDDEHIEHLLEGI